MSMWYGYVVWVCGMGMWYGYEVWLGMWSGYVVWVCGLAGYVVWVCGLGMKSGWVWVYGYVVWVCGRRLLGHVCHEHTQKLQFHDLRSGPLKRRAKHALAGCGFPENR